MEIMRYSPWLGTELRKDPANGKFVLKSDYDEDVSNLELQLEDKAGEIAELLDRLTTSNWKLANATARAHDAEMKLAAVALASAAETPVMEAA